MFKTFFGDVLETYFFFFHFLKVTTSKENGINNEYILERVMYIYDCQSFKITDTNCGMSMWPERSF